MIPYATFTYFGVLLYAVVPSIAAGLIGRAWLLRRLLLVLATVGMLLVQYGGVAPPRPDGPAIQLLWLVAGFALVQWTLAWALLLVRQRRPGRDRLKQAAFFATIGLALVPLVVARVADIVPGASLAGFVGLSYVTFRAVDVLICVHDRVIKDLSPGRYLLFLLFFPTISAGPIDRYRRFVGDLDRPLDRAAFFAGLDVAVHQIMTGFALKFVLAELVRRFALEPAGAMSGPLGLLPYAYAYTAYLYCDFAGYSAFAIGIARLFGIDVPANLRRPFLAPDIREFWNRWHISLSTWMRDHVYMRFVMTSSRAKWFPDRHQTSYAGLFVSFGLMGAWHGLEAHFLLYGLYHAGLLIGHDLFSRWNATRGYWRAGPVWRVAGIGLTFHAVCVGMLLFSGRLV